MKEILKKLLYKFGVKPTEYIDVCFQHDCEVYKKGSSMNNKSPEALAAKIRVISHTIEKALSLLDCRDDFGVEKVTNLISILSKYKELDGNDVDAEQMAESIIRVYANFRKERGLDISFIPDWVLLSNKEEIVCGSKVYSSRIDDFSNFASIANARHSVRNYSDKGVELKDIEQAIKIAQTAPSACNRQATRVYAITDPAKINSIKQRHGGIRSFGQPSVIFVIAQDLSLYLNEYERNTWLVDAGIFCMNMLYALNSVGIVNCPVIWGGMNDEDKFIKDLIGMNKLERVAILVVGGYAPEEGVKVASSPKRNLDNILTVI